MANYELRISRKIHLRDHPTPASTIHIPQITQRFSSHTFLKLSLRFLASTIHILQTITRFSSLNDKQASILSN